MVFRKRRPIVPPLDPQVVGRVTDSGLFDAAWYLHRYPETAGFRAGPLAHFCQYGLVEHRDPGPNFSTQKYLRHRPNAGTGDVPPFFHAITDADPDTVKLWLADDVDTFQWLLERSGLFDAQGYVERNYDVRRTGADPIQHFVEFGAPELREAGPGFDAEYYIDENPDYALLARSPIEHFLRIGCRAGAKPRGPTPYARWIAAFDDLTDADLDRIRSDGEAAALPSVFGLRMSGGPTAEASASDSTPEDAQIGVTWRFHHVPGTNKDEAAATTIPDGAIVLLYGHDVQLRPHAAYVLATALVQANAAAAYCDHDHIGPDGTRAGPIFKPAMSPEFMKRLPYAGPLIAIRIDTDTRHILARAITEARNGLVAHAFGNVLLNLDPRHILRVPHVLYHLPGTGIWDNYASIEPIPYVPLPPEPVAKLDGAWPSVRIIIPTRDRARLLKDCIDSVLAKTDYPQDLYGITIVNNDSMEAATQTYFESLRELSAVSIVSSGGTFNFAKVCNDGAANSNADILVFLNNDMTVIKRDWLQQLVSFASKPEFGVVGAQLLYPDGGVQHGGVVLGVRIVGAHRLVGITEEQAACIDVTREMVAVTGACLALRRSLFEEIGGFDPVLAVAFNDTKLCIAATEAGYRNIYIAEPLLYHHESISRGHDISREKRHRNHREAIYVRERYADLLINDSSYNPNLSLQKVGALAFPPRVIRPWRRSISPKRVLLLSWTHSFGSGVAMVIMQQAIFLRDRGWDVYIGGPTGPRDLEYPGCKRVALRTVSSLASYAVSEAMDCVIVHTPPYFSVTRYLGRYPVVYAYDHGEPSPGFFSNVEEREGVDWEKRICIAGAKRVFVISEAIYRQQYRRDAFVLRNGNDHLSTWSSIWAKQRGDLRKKFGFEGCYVILNVCRFGRDDRLYKGIDAYISLSQQAQFVEPSLATNTIFVLAGRGNAEDIAYVTQHNVKVFANVSDDTLTEIYAASDLYLNLSKWEGYNLGIGQARAMGLPVISSDIPAHREFGNVTSNELAELSYLVKDAYTSNISQELDRRAVIESWREPLTILEETMRNDCS